MAEAWFDGKVCVKGCKALVGWVFCSPVVRALLLLADPSCSFYCCYYCKPFLFLLSFLLGVWFLECGFGFSLGGCRGSPVCESRSVFVWGELCSCSQGSWNPVLVCRCFIRSLEWYQDKNLGEIILTGDPKPGLLAGALVCGVSAGALAPATTEGLPHLVLLCCELGCPFLHLILQTFCSLLLGVL